MEPVIEPSRQLKRIGIFLVLAIVFIVVLLRVVQYFTTGTLVLQTNDQAAVSMIQQDGGHFLKSGHGNISAHVPAGSYTLSVRQKSGNSTQIVTTVVRRQSKSIQLTVRTPATPEPASSRDAVNLVVTDQAASFIDTSNNNLYRVDSAGNETLLDSAHSLTSVRWANPFYGIGQGSDKNLYSIDGTTISPLTLPTGFQASTQFLSFVVMPDESVYVSDGSVIYKRQVSGSYVKVYQVSSNMPPLLLVSAQGDTILTKTAATTTQTNSDEAGSYIVIDGSGHIHSHEGLTYVASLSPDGKYIALSGDSLHQVYDSSFNKVVSLPTGGLTTPSWLDGHTIIYGITGDLWQFDIHTGQATLLGSTSSVGYISQVTIDQGSKYAYVRVQKTVAGDGFQLERISLSGAQPSATMMKLGIQLPNTAGGCSLGYEDFGVISVIAHGSSDEQSDCIVAAQNYLQLYNVNDPSIHITFSTSA